MSALADAALAWRDAGFCVLPAASDGSKMPAVAWKAYQTELPARESVEGWTDWAGGIGMVCGAVGGNVEMMEIEGKAVDLLTPFLQAVGTASGTLLGKLMTYVEITPSGGYHWLYRVDGPVAGNTKLASRPAAEGSGRDTLIETRGEGGWTVLAPSAGRTHPTGKAWRIAQGAPAVVATLTETERDTLHGIARMFDQMPEVIIEHREALPVTEGELTPGQDYESRMSWGDILTPHGWTLTGRQGEKELWTRPGKDAHHGPSATTNYDGNDNLYVFTSSTEFEPQHSYTKFAAYAVLHHHGDYSAAARELRKIGYGSASTKTSTAQAESRATLSLIQGGASGPTTSGANALAPEDSSSPARRYALTDTGNAHRMIDVEAARLRYSPERKEWLYWEGGRWRWNPSDAPAIRAMWQIVELTKAADADEGKWLFKSQSATAIERAVRLARTDDRMLVHMSELDAHPYELNTPSGVVDLTTTEVSVPDPTRLHTRMTGVPIVHGVVPTKWLAFLEETFSGDAELIDFVQRLAGYSATGRVTHHVLPFLHGATGANGKSVFLEVLMAVLGTYAGPAPADFLLAGGNVHESYTADLAGMRLVVCSEVGRDAKFHEQKIKHLTGGDMVKGRFLYGKPFTFPPSHHMWLMGNHQPQVDAGGESFWRRLRLIPFLHTVPVERRDPGLAAKLVAEEGPAILAWVVEGARKQLAGLAEPDSVKAATSGYAEEEDVLGQFIEERIRFGGGEHVRMATSDMRHAYEQWCFSEGEKPIPSNVFGREIKARGAGTHKSHGRRFYTNVTLMRPEDKIAPRPEQLRYGD